jgi:hypothetical protein
VRHDTRRAALTATAYPALLQQRLYGVPMPFFDSTIQFLGFDEQLKYESLCALAGRI